MSLTGFLTRFRVFVGRMRGGSAHRSGPTLPRMRIRRLGCLLAAVTAQIAPAQAQSAADAGREIYAEHCGPCHGERLMATGAAPDLKLLRAEQRVRFDEIVRKGKGQMPAWAGMLSDEEIDNMGLHSVAGAELD